MVSASRQRDDLAAAVRAAAEVVRVEEIGGEALACVQRAVGASNVLLYRYDEQGAPEAVAGSLACSLPDYSRELFEEDPVQRHLRGIEPHPDIVLTIHQMDQAAYRRSAAYCDFYRRYDVEHLLGCWLTDQPYGAAGMTGILFTRAITEPDFSELEATVLAGVLPAFRAAARRGVRFEQLERQQRALGAVVSAIAARPTIALDCAGKPLWLSPEAEALLAPRSGRARAIPAELAEGARRLGLLAMGEASAPPRFALTLVLEDGRAVRAELSVTRTSTGEPIVTAALDPPSPARPAIERVAELHRLTRAEIAVLGCLAEGLSNRTIAERLFVSIETVKTHVQRILGKLGVASRTQAALLARDAGA